VRELVWLDFSSTAFRNTCDPAPTMSVLHRSELYFSRRTLLLRSDRKSYFGYSACPYLARLASPRTQTPPFLIAHRGVR